VRWVCSDCGGKLKAGMDVIGEYVTCPNCGGLEQVPADLTLQQPGRDTARQLAAEKESKLKRMAIGSVVLLLVWIAILLTFLHLRKQARVDAERARAEARTRIETKIEKAKGLIQVEKYQEAKRELEEARAAAEKDPAFAAHVAKVRSMQESDEIQCGGQGMVKVGRSWYSPEDLPKAREKQKEADKEIQKLCGDAIAAIEKGELAKARDRSKEALELIERWFGPSHPEYKGLLEAYNTIGEELETRDMLARGLVKYKDKWVKPDEKFELEQQDKGLVKHGGKWVTLEEKFEQDQLAKGLVKHDGKWITPDEKRVAEGFIQFEGRWIKPEERNRVLAQRKEEQERRARAEAKRREAEGKKADAYTMSQQFIKDKLKAPSSARFPPRGDPAVVVTWDEKEEKFTVMAWVEAQNVFGTYLRSKYLCVLWPTGGDMWRCSLATLQE